nr:MAG: hypothetical protein [Microvirus Sku211]
MNILIIGPDGSTQVINKDLDVQGCFYPKGMIFYFNTWDDLINFVEDIPDDAVNYLDNPDTIGMYFTRDYYYIYKPKPTKAKKGGPK